MENAALVLFRQSASRNSPDSWKFLASGVCVQLGAQEGLIPCGFSTQPKGPRIVPFLSNTTCGLGGGVAAGGDSRTLLCCFSPQLDPQAVQTKNWHMDVIEMNGVSGTQTPFLGVGLLVPPQGELPAGVQAVGYRDDNRGISCRSRWSSP